MKRALLTLGVAVVFLATTSQAFKATGQKWRPGTTVNMQLQLGSSSSPLIDGSADWNAVADGAFATWNQYLNGIQIATSRGASAVSAGNGIDTVSFGNTVYGEPFGNGVLAITESLYRVSDSTYTEADVIFNTGFSWNSYRGNLRSASGGGTLVDLRRVALHEFGHVLGLDHPDDYGQNVVAVMNSHVSNVDALQADDINGVQSIYGTRTTAQPPPPSDTLTAGARLAPGQTLISSNSRFRLVYQTDGNLVLYDDTAHTAAWSTGTTGSSAGFLILQTDGNLVAYNGAGQPQWWTGSTGNTNAKMILQADGNLVIYNGNGQPVWDRFSAGQ